MEWLIWYVQQGDRNYENIIIIIIFIIIIFIFLL